MSTLNSSGSSTSNTTTSLSASRLTGMFSGLDTDSIVKSMVSSQQIKIDSVKAKQTKQEWYNEALQSVKDKVGEFMSTYVSVTGSKSLLKSSAYGSYKTVTSSTSNAAEVTGSSSSITDNITLRINKLAQNTKVSSASKVSINGTEISSNNTTTLENLSLATPLTFSSSGKISFAINGKTFSFTKDTTLQSMINTINTDTTANVTMTYSRLTDTFSLEANSGGSASSVSITNYQGNAFGTNSAFKISAGTFKNGTDSEAVINGTTVTRNSNEYTIDGIFYKLKKVTQGTSEETISYSIEQDYSATVSSVSSFVDAYNALYKDLKGLLNESDYSKDYQPLTDTQKSSMTADQVTAWEKKAKSGLLRHNSDLEKMISGLKNAFVAALGGTEKNASEIGIKAAGYFESNAGQIVLDEDALTKALQNNPQEVVAMFTNGSSISADSEQGLIYKIKSSLTDYTDVAKTSMATATKRITTLDTEISNLEDKLSSLSDRYYKKFSILEKSLSKLNSQSSYISQLFSSGSNG